MVAIIDQPGTLHRMAKTTLVGVRIDSTSLQQLEVIGKALAPKPLNRSEMINVAIREYVERHAPKKSPRPRNAPPR